ncbi:MAG: family transposase [Streptosporangiaceae bacterium]|jgi:hypothetical protein|nr:family transposase [Streptosporangiaceae bacterium]
MLDVSRELAQLVSRLLYTRRQQLGIRKSTRALSPYRQAVLALRWALRWFRGHTDIPALGRDAGISRSTAYRYIDEVSTFSPSTHPTCTKP